MSCYVFLLRGGIFCRYGIPVNYFLEIRRTVLNSISGDFWYIVTLEQLDVVQRVLLWQHECLVCLAVLVKVCDVKPCEYTIVSSCCENYPASVAAPIME